MHDRPETTVQEVLDYICQNPGRGQALPVTLRSLPHAPDGQWGNVKVSPRAVGPVGRASRVRPCGGTGPCQGDGIQARATTLGYQRVFPRLDKQDVMYGASVQFALMVEALR